MPRIITYFYNKIKFKRCEFKNKLNGRFLVADNGFGGSGNFSEANGFSEANRGQAESVLVTSWTGTYAMEVLR